MKRFLQLIDEFRTYLKLNQPSVIDYCERYWKGLPISISRAESTVDVRVNARMVDIARETEPSGEMGFSGGGLSLWTTDFQSYNTLVITETGTTGLKSISTKRQKNSLKNFHHF